MQAKGERRKAKGERRKAKGERKGRHEKKRAEDEIEIIRLDEVRTRES